MWSFWRAFRRHIVHHAFASPGPAVHATSRIAPIQVAEQEPEKLPHIRLLLLSQGLLLKSRPVFADSA